MNYCERGGVWAAFCERSYEGIGFNEDGIVQGLKPRQMFEDTKKFAIVQIFQLKVQSLRFEDKETVQWTLRYCLVFREKKMPFMRDFA